MEQLSLLETIGYRVIVYYRSIIFRYLYLTMGRGLATSSDLRKLIVKQFDEGKSVRQISQNLDIAKSTVGDIIKKYKSGGDIETIGKKGGRPKQVSERCRRMLVRVCKSGRRNTLREVTSLWNLQTGLGLSRECCRKWIHKSGLGFYKVRIPKYALLFHTLKKYFFRQKKNHF